MAFPPQPPISDTPLSRRTCCKWRVLAPVPLWIFEAGTAWLSLAKKRAAHRRRQTQGIVASSKIQPFTGAQGLETEHKATANQDQAVRGTKVANKFL